MTALEPREAGHFWHRLGPAIDQQFGRPRAILAISAHTLARTPILLAGAQHHAVYDFGGFPPELYRLRYDAPGAPQLADRVVGLLGDAGLPCQREDAAGLDHGIWVPLRFIYPDASVPVLPLAFVPSWSPAQLHHFGQALAPLAAEGVLVIGTGSLTHNLGMVFGATRPAVDAPEIAESAAFRRWVHERATAGDVTALNDYRRLAPHAALMHPSDEHWLPWYPAMGAGAGADDTAQAVRLHESLTFGCLAMDAYAFGPSAPTLAAAIMRA
jgi:4,5-DOPA dioxygenase extradiol